MKYEAAMEVMEVMEVSSAVVGSVVRARDKSKLTIEQLGGGNEVLCAILGQLVFYNAQSCRAQHKALSSDRLAVCSDKQIGIITMVLC